MYIFEKGEFFKMLENNELFQSTMYAGHGYGSKKADIERQEKLYEQQQKKIGELQFFIDKNRVSATSAIWLC